MKRMYVAATVLVAIFIFVSCSEIAKSGLGNVSIVNAAETKPSPSAAPVTGKTAYWEMYKSAYKWAPDIVALRLVPKDLSGVSSANGRAMVWEGTFASPSQRQYRIFTYAVAATAPDVYKGVTVGNAAPWGGPSRDVMPVRMSDVTTDSDVAFSTAAADADAWLKKNPGKKLTSFQLGNAYSFPSPVWYLMWGDKKSGYVAIVSATTGKVLKR